MERLIEILGVFAIIIAALALWDKASAQRAQAEAVLMKQGGYTSLELMGGQALTNYIFGGNQGFDNGGLLQS